MPIGMISKSTGMPRLQLSQLQQMKLDGRSFEQSRPLAERIDDHYEQTPERRLADSDFAKLDDIKTLHTEHEIDVYSRVNNAAEEHARGNYPNQPKPWDAPGVGKWRTRMGTTVAKTIHQRRSQTSEWASARVRDMGLFAILMRGLEKVR